MELYLIPWRITTVPPVKPLALGPDQILVHQNRRQYGRDTLTLAGRTFQVAGELPEFLDNGFSTADIVTSLFIVTPDYDTGGPPGIGQRQLRRRRQHCGPGLLLLRHRRGESHADRAVQRHPGVSPFPGPGGHDPGVPGQ